MKRMSNIMRTESFHADDLARLLRRNKIATMSELKKALGTQVEVTVFRKLKQLSYRSSYSHRSRYYTLDEIARFDPRGLWSFQSVWFSRQGTLVATAEAFVENSAAGHFVEELDNLLGDVTCTVRSIRSGAGASCWRGSCGRPNRAWPAAWLQGRRRPLSCKPPWCCFSVC